MPTKHWGYFKGKVTASIIRVFAWSRPIIS
jgi:hypothetical protein